jgi:hypothetical protein
MKLFNMMKKLTELIIISPSMEKRSERFLSREAATEIYYLGWDTPSFRSRHLVVEGALRYAERRKSRLVELVNQPGGLLSSIKNLQTCFKLGVESVLFRAIQWNMGNLENAKAVEKIVSEDVGKIGVH